MNESSVMDSNVSCTASELREALNGHFVLSYAAFGNDNDKIPTNDTVKEWKDEYKKNRKISTLSPSDYAPYVYDAIWVYAKAVMQLIKEGILSIYFMLTIKIKCVYYRVINFYFICFLHT